MDMEKWSLRGQVAIVTGAGGGLGTAICLALAEAGADIVATDMRAEENELTSAKVTELGRKSLPICADITDSRQVDQMVEKAISTFGKVDILVNNAGIVREQSRNTKPLWEISDKEWHLGIDTNLSGAFFCCRAVGKHMVERRQGSVINISSGSGLRGSRDTPTYCAAKAGVIMLTKCLALNWAEFGIRVNSIAPGTFATWRTPEEYEGRAKFVPLGRVGQPEDIGPLAVYLASHASDYVTGQVFSIDGGESAGNYSRRT